MKTDDNVFPKLEQFVSQLHFDQVPFVRKTILQPLIDFVKSKAENEESIRLNFICTHNSRRSHFAQIWTQTAASYFDIKNVTCFSGGTKTTALFPKVIETLKDIGFEINLLAAANNPIYTIKYSQNVNPIIGFSKPVDHNFNPVSGFAAIMTCSQADGECPFIAGAEKRIAINYDDPKEFDDMPVQNEKYHERSLQIATEMFYVFSQIK